MNGRFRFWLMGIKIKIEIQSFKFEIKELMLVQ
jgi:hypothetical protein